MPAPKLKIIRVPLEKPIPDIRANFPENLGELHLELLENKLKLKKGLPLIPLKTAVKPKPKLQSPSQSAQPSPAAKTNKPQPKSVSRDAKSSKSSKPTPKADEELISALGASDGERPSPKRSPPKVESKPKPVENVDIEFVDEDPPKDAERDKMVEEEVPIEDPPVESTPIEDPPVEELHEEVPVEGGEPGKTPEELEEEDREDYLARLRLLKKQHPEHEFPPYSREHTDKTTLKRIYNDAYQDLTIDDNVDGYETVLRVLFIGMGMFGKRFISPSFKDFASSQLKKMKKYRRLLYELGDKSYMNYMNSWPVEVRLLGLVIFDAMVFWLAHVAATFLGATDLIQLFTGVTTASTEPAKSRMRGPKTKIEDIKNMASKDD